MRLLMIVHGRVKRPRDAGVERPRDRRVERPRDAGVERPRDRRVKRPSETSARHSFALCVLLVIIIQCTLVKIESLLDCIQTM